VSQRLVATVDITRARLSVHGAHVHRGRSRDRRTGRRRRLGRPGRRPLLADIQANSAASLTAYTNSNRAALDGGLTNGLEYEATTENATDHTEPRIAGVH